MRDGVMMSMFFVAALGSATPGFAQGAALSGRVTDPQRAAVTGADVRLTREDGTGARHTISGASGEYHLNELQAGVFVVDIAKAGFRRRTEVVVMTAGIAATLDVQLDVSGVNDSVVVTAAGLPQVTQETSKAITIVDAQEIQARNEHTLSEIVRFTPGVQVRNNGGPGQATQMRIRGLRQDAAAVLIDGMRFRDAATTQADVTSFLANLNFVAADRVEVLRGSGSSLYGTNAVGGVVNVVTRAGGGPRRTEGQIEGGSLGHIRARGSVGGGAFADRLHYAAGVSQVNLLDGFDGNDRMRSTGGHGRLHYDVSPTASLMLRAFGSDDRVSTNVTPTTSGIPAANIPPTTIVNAVPVAPEQIARANQGLPFEIGNATYIPGRDDPDSRRASAFHTTALQFRHSGWSAMRWQVSYQHVHTGRTFLNGTGGPAFQPAADHFSNFVGSIDTIDVRGFMTPTPWVSLVAGYEFERERYGDRQDDNLPSPRRTQTDTRIHQDASAGFASAQLALFDRRVQVAVSGRVQRFRLSNPRLTAVGTTSPYDAVPPASPPQALTGDVSAAYLPAPNTKLRIHGGNAYRAPALYERFGGGFATDPVTGRVLFSAYGDPRLEPDRYKAIDAGLEQYVFNGRVLVSTSVFYNDVTSLTAFESAGGIRPDTDPYGRALGYVNGSGGFSRGVEIAVDARPSAALRLSGAYTYTRSETEHDITIPDFYRVPGVFGHTVTIVVTRRWHERIDTTFDVFHGSETYGSFSAAGRPRAYRYPGFTKAAVIAGYRVRSHATAPLRVYFKLDNVFDQTYYENGWRNLGRTVGVGLSIGF